MIDEEQAIVERLQSHMGKQDISILLADCRKAAALITALAGERDRMWEDLGLADAALRGSNMNMTKLIEAIAPALQAAEVRGAEKMQREVHSYAKRLAESIGEAIECEWDRSQFLAFETISRDIAALSPAAIVEKNDGE